MELWEALYGLTDFEIDAGRRSEVVLALQTCSSTGPRR